MTIDEAIKTLEGIRDDPDWEWDPEGVFALNLGIEALKEVQSQRRGNPMLDGELLPGETEE